MPLLVPLDPPPARTASVLRVGLLGGSFNPAHEGHRHISIEALKRLGLDQVWWLVSPQNPLKSRDGMASLKERLASAAAIARHPRLKVMALESSLGTRFTVELLQRLATWPGHRFVWMMGADNLVQLPRWRHWRQVMALSSVAILERHPYSYGSLAGPVAVGYQSRRVAEHQSHELFAETPPRWTFLRMRPHPASSTAIRRRAESQGSGPSLP
ncbi:nicotinate-nucleotide adenylyltransferase [Arboricoccus pini]|uniref:Probable nicotinate-nucleotide adenylyltransferase n=1 Tax=Arboricoccus pini TaxID=1963835 RepID=A0A212Q2Z9_9PROT|nr:nicotinate-nucleotide adenylyltransferase [Arboricoccus pini]SNB53579.1 nicotinate-nucleotide adenylyltransferase [Arboricoccus pini]